MVGRPYCTATRLPRSRLTPLLGLCCKLRQKRGCVLVGLATAAHAGSARVADLALREIQWRTAEVILDRHGCAMIGQQLHQAVPAGLGRPEQRGLPVAI